MKYRRVATVMAGGSGERFWPLSTPERPKQLLRLTDPNQTMLEEAVRRIEPVVGSGNVYVSIGRPIEEPVRKASLVSESRLLVEPAKKSTLGALVWMAANLLAEGDQPTSIAVVTADHKIGDPEQFRRSVESALTFAEETGALGTIGITPTRPETGFGYIESGEEAQNGVLWARRFREKPSLDLAQEFVRQGSFYWNGGMFFWTLDAFLAELERVMPDVQSTTLELAKALAKDDRQLAAELFDSLPSQSVDYALMERAAKVFVVPASFPWDDVGSLDALERSLPADTNGNVLQGAVTTIEVQRSIAYNDSAVKLALIGVEDVIVVTTADAVLVCRKDLAQRVKEIATGSS